MSRPLGIVPTRVKRTVLLCLTLAATPLFAVDVDPKLEKIIREALPVCADTTVKFEELPVKLPPRFSGLVVRTESKRHACEEQLVSITSPTGGFFLGQPWPLANEEGANVEEKLRSFTYRNLQESITPVIDRTMKTDDGLYRVTLLSTTENGKMPMEGTLDPDGRVFFFGTFRHLGGGSVADQRVKALEPIVAQSPSKGATNPAITVLEFSDFECPSCRRASGYMDAILAKHGDKVRYVRYDVPLNGHPWAFAAALAGRAIHRQNPELFWTFKKQVYDNQENLNAFMFWDWARGFAQDHDLDLKRYDADLGSQEIKDLLLKGEGLAFANDVRATPTYMVNGVLVDAGDDGSALASYIEKALVAK
ncbi:MAG: thioredoxin domain-containing protein [Acidobacteria bacterium]|nr:thioredoxin domain-containing protein [Acidobacteriota bacterium]MBV9476894.1 thioredoxin domain-containing protein [Acidobacteriota bacterium]